MMLMRKESRPHCLSDEDSGVCAASAAPPRTEGVDVPEPNASPPCVCAPKPEEQTALGLREREKEIYDRNTFLIHLSVNAATPVALTITAQTLHHDLSLRIFIIEADLA